jgi:hypothetical protein
MFMILTQENAYITQHSFQKLPLFTMLNMVQDPLACKINASVTRAAVLLPFT